MNRHERRRAKVSELKMILADQIRGVMCAWKGCGAVCKPDPDLPGGWSALLLKRTLQYYANILDMPARDWLRDACLCPQHTRMLDSQLIDLGRELNSPAAGTA